MHRTAHAPAGRPPAMITVRMEKRYGTAIMRFSVTAASIGEALELAGKGARVVFPIDGEEFFARADVRAPEGTPLAKPRPR